MSVPRDKIGSYLRANLCPACDSACFIQCPACARCDKCGHTRGCRWNATGEDKLELVPPGEGVK